MNPILFSFGKIEIRWYSFCILVGIIIAYLLANKESKKFDYPKDFFFNLAFWVVLFGIIGARLYYVLFSFDLFKYDFLEIFKVWNGGLAIHGGIIAGLITLIIYCKKNKVSILKTTDIVSISLLLAQACGRWGNFFNSEAYGPITTYANLKGMYFIPSFVIKGMKIGGIYYHPTFYYEFLWCLLGALVLYLIRKFFKYLKTGQLSCLYFMWYGVGRCFIEYLRQDSLMLGSFKIAQVFSVITFLLGLIGFIMLFGKGLKNELYYNNTDCKKIKKS